MATQRLFADNILSKQYLTTIRHPGVSLHRSSLNQRVFPSNSDLTQITKEVTDNIQFQFLSYFPDRRFNPKIRMQIRSAMRWNRVTAMILTIHVFGRNTPINLWINNISVEDSYRAIGLICYVPI